MVAKLALVTTFFRVLLFVWSLIYTIEIGTHVLSNKEYGGALDYMPLRSVAGVAIAFFIISTVLNAFGVYGSFTGLRQSPKMRGIRVAVECVNFSLWFMTVWIVFYAPKIDDIDEDPQNDAINDALYWSNPWTVPALMMAAVILGLVIAETRHENKETGVSGVYDDVPMHHKGDVKSDVHTDVRPDHDSV